MRGWGVGRRGAGMFAWLPSKLLQRRVPRELGDTINSNQANDLCRISTATTQQLRDGTLAATGIAGQRVALTSTRPEYCASLLLLFRAGHGSCLYLAV